MSLVAQLQLVTGVGGLQRLGVGVHGDEFDALQIGFDHAIDGVAPPAAHPDHFNCGKLATSAASNSKHGLVLLTQPSLQAGGGKSPQRL